MRILLFKPILKSHGRRSYWNWGIVPALPEYRPRGIHWEIRLGFVRIQF